MKKKILALAVIAICISIISYGTLAFYTSSKKAENVITSGNVDIELLEWADKEKKVPYDEKYPDNTVTGILPGTDSTKVVEVKNSGDNPAWIRVSVDKDIILESDEKGDIGMMTMDYDLDHWTYLNGFYYYDEALKPGMTTEPLFANIRFDEKMSNSYQNCKAKVEVKAYAVQTANNGLTVEEASGWPAVK